MTSLHNEHVFVLLCLHVLAILNFLLELIKVDWHEETVDELESSFSQGMKTTISNKHIPSTDNMYICKHREVVWQRSPQYFASVLVITALQLQ